MKKYIYFIFVFFGLFSCHEDINITFNEVNFETSKSAEISINYPKAEGHKAVATLINETLQSYIVNQTNLGEDSLTGLDIEEAAQRFNAEFETFKTNFPESSQKWEAFIDGEVTYTSSNVICVAVNSYLDTGGAHGNTTIRFFNFNPQTGQLMSKSELISNTEKLSEVIASHLKEHAKSNAGNTIEDYFFGKTFQLPESIGYSDEGLIILYNPYEIASYDQGIIEFTIPFEELDAYLNVH